MEEVNTINTNNDYIPDPDNNDGMKETIKKIIKEGKKVKVYGNEFDFAKYNTEKIVKINGEELPIDDDIFYFDDKGRFIFCLKKNVKLHLNGKTIETKHFSLNKDFSIENVYFFHKLHSTSSIQNNSSYHFNDSDTEIQDVKSNICFHIFNNEEDIEMLTEEQKELFEEVVAKNNNNNRIGIVFGDKKAVFYNSDILCPTDITTFTCIEKQKDNKFKFTEYDIGNFAKKIEQINILEHFGDEHICISYLNKDNQKEYCIYDLTNKQVILKTDGIAKNDDKNICCINNDIEEPFIYTTNEELDKMLKKSFDKCVQEEKQKDNNEKEKNSKNNDDAKYSTNTEKSKGKHI